MKQVDEIIYDAISADETLMSMIAYTKSNGDTGHALVSTCFEIPPDELDNTPLPNIIITFDGFQNQQTTKDCVWEAGEDRVQVGVDVAASSPDEVKQIVRKVRKTVETYIGTLYTQGDVIPELESLSSDGIAWDWMKPCYYQQITYQCTVPTETDIDNE